jgi:hypothetical protein
MLRVTATLSLRSIKRRVLFTAQKNDSLLVYRRAQKNDSPIMVLMEFHDLQSLTQKCE